MVFYDNFNLCWCDIFTVHKQSSPSELSIHSMKASDNKHYSCKILKNYNDFVDEVGHSWNGLLHWKA